MANVKKAFTGESKDLVDPYVNVSFAGHQVHMYSKSTSMKILRKARKVLEWYKDFIDTH